MASGINGRVLFIGMTARTGTPPLRDNGVGDRLVLPLNPLVGLDAACAADR